MVGGDDIVDGAPLDNELILMRTTLSCGAPSRRASIRSRNVPPDIDGRPCDVATEVAMGRLWLLLLLLWLLLLLIVEATGIEVDVAATEYVVEAVDTLLLRGELTWTNDTSLVCSIASSCRTDPLSLRCGVELRRRYCMIDGWAGFTCCCRWYCSLIVGLAAAGAVGMVSFCCGVRP